MADTIKYVMEGLVLSFWSFFASKTKKGRENKEMQFKMSGQVLNHSIFRYATFINDCKIIIKMEKTDLIIDSISREKKKNIIL